ncbi:MAG: cytochrome c maturation protein CcmE [Alphaproteobacteria bacterium]
MTRKKRRLYAVIAGMTVLGIAAALVLTAFEDNLVFFFSPTEMQTKQLAPGQVIRVGGLVEEESVVRLEDGLTVSFVLTDTANTLPVRFTGVLPDLFREGQGVIAEGSMGADGVFVARDILAKHDETYMPREVADAIKDAGHWQAEDGE